MRSVVLSSPARSFAASSWVRSALGALVLMFGVAIASPALAAESMTNGLLQTVINNLDPIQAVQTGSVVPTVSRDGSGLLTQVGFGGQVFQATGVLVPVTDPGAFPIAGIVATVANDPAAFVRANNKIGGQMPLAGVNKVCLFGTCTSGAISNLEVPISVVGKGGTATAAGAVNLTVIGAPWTQATAAVGTITQMGNAGEITQTTMGETRVNTIELVTPIFVSTNIAASAVVPVFGTLSFTITSTAPEPGTVAALGGAIIALLGVGFARRR
jgi:hypothetical protein